MDIVADDDDYGINEKKTLNRFRLQLETLWMSDIVLANGHQIENRFLSPRSSPSNSTYTFPCEEPS